MSTGEALDLDDTEARLERALEHVREAQRLEAGGGPRQLERAKTHRESVALFGWEIARQGGLVGKGP